MGHPAYTIEGTAAHALSALLLDNNIPVQELSALTGVTMQGIFEYLCDKYKIMTPPTSDDIGHNRYAPSSCNRWAACPGSIGLNAKTEEPVVFSNLCFETKFLGPIGAYINYCRALRSTAQSVEVRAGIQFGDIYMDGTSDYRCHNATTGSAHIVDLKFGEGVKVPANNNVQMAFYGLAYLHQLASKNVSVSELSMHVFQPRIADPTGPAKIWPVDNIPEFVAHWTDFFRDAIMQAEAQPGMFSPGAHCGNFCKGQRNLTCPAIKQQILTLFDTSALSTANKLSDIELGEILGCAEVVAKYLKAAKAEALKRLLITPGGIPGFKLIESFGRRRWADWAGAEIFLLNGGDLTTEDIYKTDPQSPAQVEKLIPKRDHKNLKRFIHAPSKGPAVVPISNRKKEYQNPIEKLKNTNTSWADKDADETDW